MRIWAHLRAGLAAAAFAAALPAAPATAQTPDPYARELAQKLAQAEADSADRGYARAAGPFAGAVGAGAQRRFDITLRAGQDYRFVGVCERRCRGLELRLRDAQGREIANGRQAGAAAAVRVRPAFTGRHAVEVEMARCAAPSCWFAFNVYSR